MLRVIVQSWALFLGLSLLMAGNALQGSLLGVRAVIEGFSSESYGFVSAGYFAGFLFGSYATPRMLRRVGHVRVFAALASLISAAFIIYAAVIDPIAWFAMRILVGFCFSGVYIVCESWLNDSATNETRGQTLGAYMFVQYAGIVAGQLMLNLSDPAGYDLFVLLTVMVSVSFTPILLTVSPAPLYETARPLSLRELFKASPLGFVGSLALGGAFGAMFGMSSVYATRIGLSIPEITILLTALYMGAVIFIGPVAVISDRMDRRQLIIILGVAACAACVMAIMVGKWAPFSVAGIPVYALYGFALLIGGLANPLYSLLIAHTNDYLESDQMASASGGLVFLNGLGAMMGPVAVGYSMATFGDGAFWGFQGICLLAIGVYGLYRMTQRRSVAVEDAAPYATVGPRMTAVATELATEYAIEQAQQAEEEAAAEQEAAAAEGESEEEADLRKSREATDGN